jgi:3-polyprenyl-4-hydroxybenzoate decarboxylase
MESSDASTAAGFSVRPQTISKNQAILRTSHKWLLNQIPIARCWDDDIANVKFFDSCALQALDPLSECLSHVRVTAPHGLCRRPK